MREDVDNMRSEVLQGKLKSHWNSWLYPPPLWRWRNFVGCAKNPTVPCNKKDNALPRCFHYVSTQSSPRLLISMAGVMVSSPSKQVSSLLCPPTLESGGPKNLKPKVKISKDMLINYKHQYSIHDDLNMQNHIKTQVFALRSPLHLVNFSINFRSKASKNCRVARSL